MSQKSKVDFILFVGDDDSNEDIFSALVEKRKKWIVENVSDQAKLYTCTVSRKPSYAKHYIKDPSDMTYLMNILQFET